MKGFNKVILAGNLTRDPELRYTPSGRALAKLGLAINRKWRDSQSGEMREDVTFVDVDAWGKDAETIGQYLKKGSPILLEGRLRTDTWEDKQTQQKKSRLGVVLDNFVLLSGNQGGGGFESAAPARRPMPSNSQPQPSGPDSDSMPPEEDDVPF